MATKKTGEKPQDGPFKRDELLEDLPKPGVDRFWRIRHIPTQRTAPMRVELHEAVVPGSTKLSRVIGFENAVASVKSIVEAAQLTLARNGAYKELEGDYDV